MNICKPYIIELDVVKSKSLKNKDWIVFVNDSVELNVTVKESGINKNLIGLDLRAVGAYGKDLKIFEQIEGFKLDEKDSSKFKFYPKPELFNEEGVWIIQFIISEGNKSIYLQRIIFYVVKNMESDIIAPIIPEIETLKKLNDLLNTYESDLNSVNQSVVDMEGLVVQKTNKVNTDFQNLSDGIQTQVNSLQNSIDGVNNTVNYELTKTIELKPYRLLGSSFIYFESEPFNILASELLYRGYMVFLSGIVDVNSHNTATGTLLFFKQNGKIYTNFVNLSDRVVGKNLSPSVVFGDLTTEITPNTTGFKLMVKSNILKSLNTDESIKCILTPIGLQGGMINVI